MSEFDQIMNSLHSFIAL